MLSHADTAGWNPWVSCLCFCLKNSYSSQLLIVHWTVRVQTEWPKDTIWLNLSTILVNVCTFPNVWWFKYKWSPYAHLLECLALLERDWGIGLIGVGVLLKECVTGAGLWSFKSLNQARWLSLPVAWKSACRTLSYFSSALSASVPPWSSTW